MSDEIRAVTLHFTAETNEKQKPEVDPGSDPRESLSSSFSVCRSSFHCATCTDEALPARVVRVDQETALALVAVQDTTVEVDISLVDAVAPGQVLLIHGGVAIEIVASES